MKTPIPQFRLMAAVSAISFFGIAACLAEDKAAAPAQQGAATPASTTVVVEGEVGTTPTPAPTPAPVVKETSATKLPYGVEDVLKLSRAQVSEDITLTYIQNSGTIYDLRPNDIVYLKEQGVSDKLISAMMEQRKKALDAAAAQQTAAAAAA